MDISVINSIQDQFNKNEASYLSSSLTHRKSALDFALLHDFPGRKDEEYKYTPVNRILKKNFDFERVITSKTTDLHFEDHFYKLKGNHLVFLNGTYLADRSEILNDVCCQSVTDSNQRFKDVFDALNVAFCENSLNIEVSENYRPQPFFIYYFYDSEQGQIFGNPNIQITGHSNTQIQILEKTISIGTHPVFINKKVSVNVKANAEVNITKIQNYKKHVFQVYNLEVNQDSQSKFNSNVYSFAGGLIRNNLSINQLGEHCESHMHGLYLITGQTHVDNHTAVNHTQPHSYSNELYKGILDENARAVFNGKIFVRPEAQKTNAFQSNQNINLSDEASIYTKPQLEIWADDVKCSHGCTVGQMDEEALFYLRTRGIGKNQAKALILIAFSEQSLEYIPFEFVKEEIDTLIRKRLIG
tara:strand:+ start:194 stop:1435 length:1242 start_codon:yes stop_codon:yes gene_type:complete